MRSRTFFLVLGILTIGTGCSKEELRETLGFDDGALGNESGPSPTFYGLSQVFDFADDTLLASYDPEQIIFEDGMVKLAPMDVIDEDETGFSEGIYSGTEYSDGVVLSDPSVQPVGNYESRIIDAGAPLDWSSISWKPERPTGKELPTIASLNLQAVPGNVVASQYQMLTSCSGRITVPNSPDINTGGPYAERTVSIWFNADDLTNRQVIFEEGGGSRGFNIYVEGGFLYFGGWNRNETNWQGTFLRVTTTAQEWHHAVLVLEGGTATLEPDRFRAYLDGAEIGVGEGSMIYAHSGDINYCGNGGSLLHDRDTSSGHAFVGSIADLNITNTAIGVAEINAKYRADLSTLNSDTQENQYTTGNFDMADAAIYLRFNESTWDGTPDEVTDYGGNDLHSTSSGNASPVSGLLGNAASFDGVDGNIIIPNTDFINNRGPVLNRTISLWFYANSLTGRQVIFEEGGGTRGLNVYLEDDSLYVGGWNRAETYWAGTWLSTLVSANRWNHVVLRLEATLGSVTPDSFKAYLNGVEFGSGDGAPLYRHTGDIRLGVSGNSRHHDDNTSPGYYFNGRMDEFAIWNRGLSDTEIEDVYLRAALNLKFQVRVCSQSDCSDGIYVGPDGTNFSYFSEVDNQGFALPSFDFSALGLNGRYFQYRAELETRDADETPVLESVSLPTRFPAQVSFETLGLNFSEFNSIVAEYGPGHTGSVRVQISGDGGSSWVFWNGADWAVTINDQEHNTLQDVQDHLAEFQAIYSTGVLMIRVFLISAGGVEVIELDTLTLD